mmetsp:Transcript_30806/g.52662  ORF Transcript_30806/g.52662 Transcript_30806/m.52662 type:complete len:297 (-) Transcript_30806:93-983(-)
MTVSTSSSREPSASANSKQSFWVDDHVGGHHAEKLGSDEVIDVPDGEECANMVHWRGNLVAEKEAKALRHVFDDLQDHFGHQRPDPNVRFEANLTHPGHGDVWQADLDFTYNIKGEHCKLAYIGMDMCLDLTPKKIHKYGRPMLNDYGETWVYAYLPDMTMDKIKSYVKAGTGWDVSAAGTVVDPNRNLVAIKAKLNNQAEQPKPSFWVVTEKDSAQDDVSFSRIGSVQDVHSDTSQKRIHRGVGIFSVSMEVDGTPNFKPSSHSGEVANLVFTLVSVRTWGITDCIAPIVHAPMM